jgi:hypothetical protein
MSTTIFFKSAVRFDELSEEHHEVRKVPFLQSGYTQQKLLTLDELLHLLSNLTFAELETLHPTEIAPYEKQGFIVCTADDSMTRLFHLFIGTIYEEDFSENFQRPLFAIKIKNYCQHQNCFKLGIRCGKKFTYHSPARLSDNISYPKRHPFRVIGRYLYKRFNLQPYVLQRFLDKWHHRSQYYFLKNKLNNLESLEDIIKDLPGKIILYIAQQANKLEFQYRHDSVVGLVWLPPWSIYEFQKSDYIEIDTSFKALRPYVYSIPLATTANEFFPLALVVGLSESVQLYQLFFDAIDSIGIFKDNLMTKPFLSDQGKALKSVFRDFNHFICLRHLIENFGSNSMIGQIVHRLAFSSTPEDFIYQSDISLRDIETLQSHTTLDSKQLKRLFKRFGTFDDTNPPNFTLESWFDQLIWKRAEDGVSTCSNHAEGVHRWLNNETRNEAIPRKRLDIVIKCIFKRYESAKLFLH